jgi:acyl-CoA dehydrogenase
VKLTDIPEYDDLRAGVREICEAYPGEYWRGLEPETYPQEFVNALTQAGYLAALIPEEYGGGGATLTEASIIMEEIAASGGNPAACHAQMYVMGTILRHGSTEQKQHYLPQIANGTLRLQAFGVTEPGAGSETTRIRTKAERVPEGWRINGQKIWTSRALYSDLMLLLARTTPYDECEKPTEGLSTFLINMREVDGITPADALVGEEGKGFRYILDGMNAERILIAAECIGDGRFLLEKAVAYANERVVFDKPIGSNQGVQFPLAKAYAQLRAADLMRFDAAAKYDAHVKCAAEANMAKLLCSEASWAAANAALDTHGGFGFAVEYDIERKFRETRLYQVAPINNNLVLAYVGQHVLGLPKSY